MTREEIVKALKCFSNEGVCPQPKCNALCPYWLEDEKFAFHNVEAEINNEYDLCRIAAGMLEQDARPADTGKMRPYMLDELDLLNVGVLGGTPIWIEHRSDRPNVLKWEFSGWQVLQGMERDHMLLNNDVELDLEDLNKVWRCWKRQPTQEETANASWEDEE